MSKLIISIIVPIYNQEQYLAACLDSLINQTYKHLDIILVNDGSTDKSLEICNKYRFDDRITVINKPNGGVNSARTTGLKYAKGDLITFVDSDDLVEKDTYMLVSKCFEKYECDLVGFRSILEYKKNIDCNNNIDFDENRIIKISKLSLYDNYLDGAFIGTVLWNKVWKKKCLNDVRFVNDIMLCEDALYVWKTLENVDNAVVIDELLYHYRFSFDNATNSSSLDKYYSAIKAWDHIKKSAKEINVTHMNGICKSRLRWLLKTAKCLANTDSNKQGFDEITCKIKEDEKYIRQLSKYEKISIRLLLKRRYRLFKIYNSLETFLKRVYVFYKKNSN